MSRTYAILEVSQAAYDEIRGALERAGYDHAFIDDVVDMHGIALKAKEQCASSCRPTGEHCVLPVGHDGNHRAAPSIPGTCSTVWVGASEPASS